MANHVQCNREGFVAPGLKTGTFPLIAITVLFFMWGLLTSLNDVLIPHLKALYTLTYMQAMLVQFCFFGAYFLAAFPAGMLVKSLGYQRGIVLGLMVASVGCFLFYPAAYSGYTLFLLAFFILACGITILQVAANPYVAILGNPAGASRRLTLTQGFNSLGTAIAPALGGLLILGESSAGATLLQNLPATVDDSARQLQIGAVQGPYLGLAVALLTLALLFAAVRLPSIATPARAQDGKSTGLFSHRHLTFGILAIFMYVGAEVSVGSFLINFLGEANIASLNPEQAARYVSLYWGGAMLGRFIGAGVMRMVVPGKALAFNAALSVVLIVFAVMGSGALAMWSILAVGLCNSIMFPVIFTIALTALGDQMGRASGVLCMAIVGGAIVPFAQAWLADTGGVQLSFLIPAACYVFIAAYGWKFHKITHAPL